MPHFSVYTLCERLGLRASRLWSVGARVLWNADCNRPLDTLRLRLIGSLASGRIRCSPPCSRIACREPLRLRQGDPACAPVLDGHDGRTGQGRTRNNQARAHGRRRSTDWRCARADHGRRPGTRALLRSGASLATLSRRSAPLSWTSTAMVDVVLLPVVSACWSSPAHAFWGGGRYLKLQPE
jgi:hypothetical protein